LQNKTDDMQPYNSIAVGLSTPHMRSVMRDGSARRVNTKLSLVYKVITSLTGN